MKTRHSLWKTPSLFSHHVHSIPFHSSTSHRLFPRSSSRPLVYVYIKEAEWNRTAVLESRQDMPKIDPSITFAFIDFSVHHRLFVDFFHSSPSLLLPTPRTRTPV